VEVPAVFLVLSALAPALSGRALTLATAGEPARAWWDSLDAGARLLFYVVVLLVGMVVLSAVIQALDRANPRKCPRCGTVLDQEEAKTTGASFDRTGHDLIQWTCPECGWTEQRTRGAPHRKYFGPW
jgi:predicted RNA-binding Zn-ribbon protein involved in translation (DUF1610 family)